MSLFREQLEGDSRAGLGPPLAQVIGDADPIEHAAPRPADLEATTLIVSITFGSRSEHSKPDEKVVPHVVTVRRSRSGSAYVTCTCDAMESIEKRPRGCWAMVATRSIAGIAAVA